MDLIFFPVKAESPYFLKKKAPFPPKYNADTPFRKNAPLFFVKITFLEKIQPNFKILRQLKHKVHCYGALEKKQNFLFSYLRY